MAAREWAQALQNCHACIRWCLCFPVWPDYSWIHSRCWPCPELKCIRPWLASRFHPGSCFLQVKTWYKSGPFNIICEFKLSCYWKLEVALTEELAFFRFSPQNFSLIADHPLNRHHRRRIFPRGEYMSWNFFGQFSTPASISNVTTQHYVHRNSGSARANVKLVTLTMILWAASEKKLMLRKIILDLTNSKMVVWLWLLWQPILVSTGSLDLFHSSLENSKWRDHKNLLIS